VAPRGSLRESSRIRFGEPGPSNDNQEKRSMRISASPVALLAATVLLSACFSDQMTMPDRVPAGASYAVDKLADLSVVSAEHFPMLPNDVLATINGVVTLNHPVQVFNGGFGSAVDLADGSGSEFYSLTDRGPNVAIGNNKLFAVPDFHPQIGRFRFANGVFTREEVIVLRDQFGNPKSGIPIGASGCGATGEIPFDINGHQIPFDPNGIDSEGLRVMGDGSFWVSDEYGPFLIHFDHSGNTLEQNSPCAGPNKLPAVLTLRQPNKGMEGLASIEGGTTLVGIVQNPLANGKSSLTKLSQVLRIVFVDTKTHTTKTFLYPMDDASFGSSEIEAVSNTTFLVDERDGKFFGDGSSKQKKIFLIDISDATDVSDPADGPTGLMVNGHTIEELSLADLANNHIKTVTKHLVANLLDWGYPHDKFEGMALLKDGQTIAVTNDDDFGVSDDGAGHLIQKLLPPNSVIDHNELWLFHLSRNLKSIH
jgi:hypothetical protein